MKMIDNLVGVQAAGLLSAVGWLCYKKADCQPINICSRGLLQSVVVIGTFFSDGWNTKEGYFSSQLCNCDCYEFREVDKTACVR